MGGLDLLFGINNLFFVFTKHLYITCSMSRVVLHTEMSKVIKIPSFYKLVSQNVYLPHQILPEFIKISD